MINLVWSGLLTLLLLTGCGYNGTPTRVNDFVPLTSIEITAVSPTIAAGTSTTLSAKGNFSGLFTRDITNQVVWSSNSPTVAGFVTAVNPNRVTGIAPGPATLTASLNGVSATYTLTVSSAKISTMTISPATPSIVKLSTTQFSVSGTFSDNTTQDLTFDATWSSSDPTVATVSNDPASKGLAQTILAGTTTISATFNGVSGTTQLTVTNPVLLSITITPDTPSLPSLSTSTWSFQATGHYSNGTTADLTSQVAWASSDPGIATIAATGGAATGLAKGTTSISATLPAFPAIPGTTNLTVTGGNLTGFSVSPATPTLARGTVARITVLGTFDNGSSRDITGVVTWTPADTALATVTKAGGNLAWLNANGVTPFGSPTKVTATVTTPLGTFTNSLNPTNLTVTAPTLQSLVINPSSQSLFAGISTRYTATATFNDGSKQDVTYSATWTSSDGSIATVGDSGINKGLVKGVSLGNTLINATFAGVSASSINVNVTTPILQTPVITVSGSLSPIGNQVQFTATANGQDVTADTVWSIDNPNIAILADSTNQPGQVVGVSNGIATITATFGGRPAATTRVTVQ
jgi:uncharacterized protein YjdB